jgi:hypothetical protein
MKTRSERITTRPVVTRDFEFSRHQRISLAAAFEYALPTIVVRRPVQEATRHHTTLDPRRHRRAVS